ncbi:restriction endonuclease subunit S [Corynebacterium urealyticum]|uniref:Type I restriction-modification system, specificity subunit n=1 Tax=Corynebacterium urealyticum (strain ATCC 43042 / DSM 7109) TaxID=504474 RepID=B1VGZ6_CORU7|nr:restriction endonuclease subunit S [Corynebacterium urealyticum]AGE36652.1 type I restriction-modification system, specificity subunit [Corynebacterium urealyticum DSM 7111]QQB08283.1 restriction endonuclease subunit S [Corynebacterium urealyticum]QQC41528.1 restriction endonuclease subunit S [Corynebacterium urealyticum]QQE50152.1 restriction endonuclease subunit S [Corynebacterium urealyticum]CAQ05037.1 type I restriction-modification system, specificity subunit [Corynebacterium urealytic
MIDSHFPLAPFWALSSLVNEVSTPQGELVSLDRIEGKTGRLLQGGGESNANGRHFRKDDVLFGKLRPYLAKYWLADRPGTAQGDIHVYRPTLRTDPRFLAYIVGSDYFTGLANTSSTGSKMPRVEWPKVAQFRVPFPPRRTQRAIADYLDRETAEIDAMTADLDKMEALLTERRAEILRSWFGEQLNNPRAPLATIAELYIGKMEQPRQKSADEIYAPFFHSANIRPGGMIDLECSVKHMWFRPDELDHMLLRKGDVVVVEGGAAGRPGYIAKSVDGWGIQKSVIRARPFEDKVIGKYLFYALTFAFEDGQFDLQASLATLAHFPAEKAARFRVPVRSLADQELVVARLDRDLSSLSDMLADITALRDLLAERRAALIAAAVTGQIDIPTAEEPTHA